MSQLTHTLLCVAIISGVSFDAAARGPGGGGLGGGENAAGHLVTAPFARSQAIENSNGRLAQDRDSGLSRAEDRMSAEGLKHEQATTAQAKHRTRTRTHLTITGH